MVFYNKNKKQYSCLKVLLGGITDWLTYGKKYENLPLSQKELDELKNDLKNDFLNNSVKNGGSLSEANESASGPIKEPSPDCSKRMLQNPLTREGWYCRKEEVEKYIK